VHAGNTVVFYNGTDKCGNEYCEEPQVCKHRLTTPHIFDWEAWKATAVEEMNRHGGFDLVFQISTAPLCNHQVNQEVGNWEDFQVLVVMTWNLIAEDPVNKWTDPSSPNCNNCIEINACFDKPNTARPRLTRLGLPVPPNGKRIKKILSPVQIPPLPVQTPLSPVQTPLSPVSSWSSVSSDGMFSETFGSRVLPIELSP
jgi:hypothetical protein